MSDLNQKRDQGFARFAEDIGYVPPKPLRPLCLETQRNQLLHRLQSAYAPTEAEQSDYDEQHECDRFDGGPL